LLRVVQAYCLNYLKIVLQKNLMTYHTPYIGTIRCSADMLNYVRKRIIIRTVVSAARGNRMPKSHLKLVRPPTVKRTVTPKRLPNADLRTREYLTEAEVERLMTTTKKNRWGHRDATMILVAYRHGLRASELVDLRWDQVDFRTATLHVRRV